MMTKVLSVVFIEHNTRNVRNAKSAADVTDATTAFILAL